MTRVGLHTDAITLRTYNLPSAICRLFHLFRFRWKPLSWASGLERWVLDRPDCSAYSCALRLVRLDDDDDDDVVVDGAAYIHPYTTYIACSHCKASGQQPAYLTSSRQRPTETQPGFFIPADQRRESEKKKMETLTRKQEKDGENAEGKNRQPVIVMQLAAAPPGLRATGYGLRVTGYWPSSLGALQ